MATGYAKQRTFADRVGTLLKTLEFLEALRDDERLLQCESCSETHHVPVKDMDRLSATRQIPGVLEKLEKLGWVEDVEVTDATPTADFTSNVVPLRPSGTDVSLVPNGERKPRTR